jgi:hypothetical protein
MPKALRPSLDEALAPGSYSFLILELAFKNERDLPGLVRYRLESILPRGVEGLRYYFRRIGRTSRFLVTLVKEPMSESFAPSRTTLPFALTIPEVDDREIVWVSRNASYAARYEAGLLVSVEASAETAAGPVAAALGGSATAGGTPPLRREALRTGPSVQQAIGRDDLVWKAVAAALGMALAAQLAFAAVQVLATREARLAALNKQTAVLAKLTAAGPDSAAGPDLAVPDTGLQTRAAEIQRRVSRQWKPGYCLEKLSLKAGALRLEGWGPEALGLLASLRADLDLAALELASRKEEKGFEVFVFEGEVGDD